MRKFMTTNRLVSLLLVLAMMAAELVVPIGAIGDGLQNVPYSTELEVKDEFDLSGASSGIVTDNSLTNYDDWKNSDHASVTIEEEGEERYINVFDNDAAVAPAFRRKALDLSAGIKTIAFDLRLNSLDADKNGALLDLQVNYNTALSVYFKDKIYATYNNSSKYDTGVSTLEGDWATVICVINPETKKCTVYYNGEMVLNNVTTRYSRAFTDSTNLFIKSEQATAGADFDVKNYAIYTGDVSASLLPPVDPDAPIDTFKLDNRDAGLLTDTNLTNYNAWSGSENASVSVAEEAGEKYLSVKDDDTSVMTAVQRKKLDLSTGVKTIAFDMRINEYGERGPIVELANTIYGRSYVRLEFETVFSYFSDKEHSLPGKTTITDKWVSVIIVIDPESNTYTFYYNGEEILTDESPRVDSSTGEARSFKDEAIDLEIRADKTDTGVDFDLRDYGLYNGDKAEMLLAGYTPVEPEKEPIDTSIPFDTVDLSGKSVGPLTDKTITYYDGWKNSQNAAVSVREDAGEKHINVWDNDAAVMPNFIRRKLDLSSGVKTIAFDMRINKYGALGPVVELANTTDGRSYVRLEFEPVFSYFSDKEHIMQDKKTVPGKWVSVILVVDADNNTYTFYYNGEALLTNASPRVNSATGAVRTFADEPIDLEIRSGKTETGTDFDIKAYNIWHGDKSAELLDGYTPVEPDPEPIDPNKAFDTVDLSDKTIGLLKDDKITNYYSWASSDKVAVSVKEENGQKYINVLDNDETKQPNFQRSKLDLSSGVKTIAFDMRINAYGQRGPVVELANLVAGRSYVRLEFEPIFSYFSDKEHSMPGKETIEGKWVSVILVVDADNNTYTFYYNGEALLTNASPRVNSATGVVRTFADELIDLEIRSDKTDSGVDFDIRGYNIWHGDKATELLADYTPVKVDPKPIDPSKPYDTVDLSNKAVGLLTDNKITNHYSWSSSDKAAVSVKEENGQKYINVLDNDDTKQPNFQRSKLDLGSGVKTIAFDMRINAYGERGPIVELANLTAGRSYVRLEFEPVFSYFSDKEHIMQGKKTVAGKWVSVILVIDGDNNTYTFYYNGEALLTNASPRVNSEGTVRSFADELIDLEIRSDKTDSGVDYDIRNYNTWYTDKSAELLAGYTPVKEDPKPIDPNKPFDTVDLSNKTVGLLTDNKMTNHYSWNNTQAQVSVKEENGQKYINVLDNDPVKQPNFQRTKLDLSSGIKTIAFDLRINNYGGYGPVLELANLNEGRSYVRIELEKEIYYFTNKEKGTDLMTNPGQWLSVVLVLDADKNTYSFYYNGEVIVKDATPRTAADGTVRNFTDELIDLEIRSINIAMGCDFDIRNYNIWHGDKSSELAWSTELIEPELPKDALGLPVYDSVDLSQLETGVFKDGSSTNYSAWSKSQNAGLTVKQEGNDKYINVKDKDATILPAFQRYKLDFRKGAKTIVFDLRLNQLGENQFMSIELCDITKGLSWMRFDLHEDQFYYYLNAAKNKLPFAPEMDKWVTVIITIDADTNGYSLYYGGEEIVYEVPPRNERLFSSDLIDLQIRSQKTSDDVDFDIRNYRVYAGNVAYTLMGKDDPYAPVDVSNAGEKGVAGKTMNTKLGLPYSDGYKSTPLNINTSAYDTYLSKRNDLALNATAAGGSANEVKVLDPVAVQGSVIVYVSPDGDDKNNGSKDKPLKTVQRALTFASSLEEAGAKGVVIYLRGGNYFTPKAINITSRHSGKNGIPVIISSYPGEEAVITGGMDIAGTQFSAVTDPAVLKKLQDNVEDKIVAFDLKTLGITKFGSISGPGPEDGPDYSVQINGTKMTLARYPNSDTIPLKRRVIDIGPITQGGSLGPAGTNMNSTGVEFVMDDRRPLQWENDGNIWFKGNLYAEWRVCNQRVANINADKRSIKLEADLTTDGQVYNQGALASESNRHYYYNILEELDVPGEYYLDTTNGILYIYPTAELKDTVVTYTGTTSDLISIKGAENVVLNDLTIRNTNGAAVRMYKCDQVVVQNCDISYAREGVLISGQNSGVICSSIKYILGKSVLFADRTISKNNFLQNSSIYPGDLSNEKSSEVGVYGTGHVVSHNLFQDTYAASIYLMWSTECVIEYNEIIGGPVKTQDMGSIYMPSYAESYNNHVRFNYIHDTGIGMESTDPWAIYFDDASSGSFAYGNIIQNTPGGLFTNSGSEHVFVDNVVVNGRKKSKTGVNGSESMNNKIFENHYPVWGNYMKYAEQYKTDAQFRNEMQTTCPARARLYERLNNLVAQGFTGEGYLIPHHNVAINNIIANHGDITLKGDTDSHTIKNNTILEDDPFVDSKNHNFALKSGVQLAEGTTYVTPDMSRMGIVAVKHDLTPVYAYYPENGATGINPKDILLKWSGAEGADNFDVIIGKDKSLEKKTKTFSVKDRVISLVDERYFDFDTTYYWTVKASTASLMYNTTEIMCDEIYSFTTMTYEQYMEENGADVSLLKERVEEAKALLAEIKETAEGGPYFYGTKAMLQTAIETAEAIVAIGKQQEQDDVDDAELELRNAMIRVKANRPVQYVTFPDFKVEDWRDNYMGGGTQYTSVVGDELQLDFSKQPKIYTEIAYEQPIGDREILCFKYMVDRLDEWSGFCIGQTDIERWVRSDEGYLIVIKSDVIELQIHGQIIITVENNNELITGGKWYDIQIAALKNVDGSVQVIFGIDGNIIINYTDYDDPAWGTNGFGFAVNKANGVYRVKKTDNFETELADYIALDEEIAREPKDGASIYSERTWKAYQEVLNAAKNFPRDLTRFDQKSIDEMTKKLREAREALLTPEQEAALNEGKDPNRGGDGAKTDSKTLVIIITASVAVVLIAGGVVLMVVLKKRKKKATPVEAETQE